MFSIEFDPRWEEYYSSLPPDIKPRVWKKILQIQAGLPGRHLQHGIPIFVEEVGQYRICYMEDKNNKIRKIYYVGKHKEYDKWNRSFKKRPYR